ncbi:MAG TPA: hypothetical protein VEZ91_10305 [Kurthia gibsonii]|nr:hypothetical protein [Kurthia gibsonii]
MTQQDRQKQTLKDDVIDQLMAIGVYKSKTYNYIKFHYISLFRSIENT